MSDAEQDMQEMVELGTEEQTTEQKSSDYAGDDNKVGDDMENKYEKGWRLTRSKKDKDQEKGVEILKEIIKLENDLSPDAAFKLAYYYHVVERESDDAIKFYNKAVDLGIKSDNRRYALYNLGLQYYEEKEYGKSEKLLRQCISEFPDYSNPYFKLGDVLRDTDPEKKEKLDEAEEMYKKANELGNIHALHRLGYLYSDYRKGKKEDRYEKAYGFWCESVKKHDYMASLDNMIYRLGAFKIHRRGRRALETESFRKHQAETQELFQELSEEKVKELREEIRKSGARRRKCLEVLKAWKMEEKLAHNCNILHHLLTTTNDELKKAAEREARRQEKECKRAAKARKAEAGK